jgi:hypothetical protein
MLPSETLLASSPTSAARDKRGAVVRELHLRHAADIQTFEMSACQACQVTSPEDIMAFTRATSKASTFVLGKQVLWYLLLDLDIIIIVTGEFLCFRLRLTMTYALRPTHETDSSHETEIQHLF